MEMSSLSYTCTPFCPGASPPFCSAPTPLSLPHPAAPLPQPLLIPDRKKSQKMTEIGASTCLPPAFIHLSKAVLEVLRPRHSGFVTPSLVQFLYSKIFRAF